MLIAVSVALGLVILAPVTLSAQDLYTWARDPHGLALSAIFAALVPVGLDVAAAACILMTIVAVWRRERPGIFGLLVWVFAATSAYAQLRHGLVERDAGRAQDVWWTMPGVALLGPLLLEVTLHRLRRWYRQETGEQHTGAAGFGSRWLPGVAFGETLAAWAASRREGIASWRDAVQFVRDRKIIAGLSRIDALHYAFGALGCVDPHTARTWLAARGVIVTQTDLDAATAGRPTAPVSAPPVPVSGPVSGPPDADGWTEQDTHAARLAGLTTKRDKIRYAYSALGTYDPPAARRWLEQYGVEVTRSESHTVARQAINGPSGEFPTLPATPYAGT